MKAMANGKARASTARRRRRASASKSKLIEHLWGLIKPPASNGTITSKIISAELRPNEKDQALRSPNRRNLFVRGALNPATGKLALWLGDGATITVHLSAFKPSGDGTKPRWSQFKIIDFGHTLRFGRYEAAADAVLHEYRRRLNRKTG